MSFCTMCIGAAVRLPFCRAPIFLNVPFNKNAIIIIIITREIVSLGDERTGNVMQKLAGDLWAENVWVE